MNIFELTLRINGFRITRAKKQLQRTDNTSLNLRLEEIVNFHRKNNPLYRNKFKDSAPVAFENLPVITKSDFQQPLDSIVSDGISRSDWYVGNTSGSSGHPFFFAKNKDSHAMAHCIAMQRYAQWEITPHDLQARFYGIPLHGLPKYKELLKDKLANRVRFPVFDLSDKQMNVYLNRFRNMKFGYIYGYTSAIVLFAKYVIKQDLKLIDICPTLKGCIVTSEVCTEDDKNHIMKAFGIPVVNEYGASETGIIAFSDRNGDWSLTTENLYVEVVDENNKPLPYNREGRILITVLDNRAYPMIRYEIGDMGVMDKVNGKLILKRLSGRVSDRIKLPSGKIAAGLTFYYVSRSVLEKLGIIKEFIVRQTAIDTFVFDAVMDRDFSDHEYAFLKAEMDKYLEPGLVLVVNKVDRISRPASGKIKHFYSEI